eukprot:6866508-Heterocapsa_arctica.AAC.1
MVNDGMDTLAATATSVGARLLLAILAEQNRRGESGSRCLETPQLPSPTLRCRPGDAFCCSAPSTDSARRRASFKST